MNPLQASDLAQAGGALSLADTPINFTLAGDELAALIGGQAYGVLPFPIQAGKVRSTPAWRLGRTVQRCQASPARLMRNLQSAAPVLPRTAAGAAPAEPEARRAGLGPGPDCLWAQLALLQRAPSCPTARIPLSPCCAPPPRCMPPVPCRM